MSLTFNAIIQRPDGVWTWIEHGPEISVSNANGVELLRFLGFEEDALEPCGGLDPAEVEARCLRASWSRGPDPALRGSESGGPDTGQCRVIESPRREGYLLEKAETLGLIARFARLFPGAKLGWA